MGLPLFQSSRPRMRFRGHLVQSSWMIAFLLLSSAIYFQKSRKRDAAISELSFRMREMEKMKKSLCQEKEDLQLRLQSQSDPAWIEMILMRDLGVVPEGWIKVRFTH